MNAQIARNLALIVMGVGLGACATTPEVSTKFVNGIHLEQYKTYTLLPGHIDESQSGKANDRTEVERAVETDLRDELEHRGLKPETYSPALTFTYAAVKRLEHAGEREWPYYEGAMDLIAKDATGRTVWSAHLQAVIDPHDKTHHQLKEAISRAFKNYPSVSQS